MDNQNLFRDIADSLVIFNDVTFNRLWELGPDCYMLYSFYYRAAKFQKNNQPWATNEFAMKGLSWGKDRLKKAKSLLRDNGFIEDTKISGEDGKITKWVIKLKYLQNSTNNPPPPENHRVVQEPTNTSNYEDKIQVTTNNPSIIPLKPDDRFEEFWAKYIPVHTSKGPKKTARDKFTRLTKTVDADEIIRGMERYIAECHKNNCYTKNVTTFLNQEQWKDYLQDKQPEIVFSNPQPLTQGDYSALMSAEDVSQVIDRNATLYARVNPWLIPMLHDLNAELYNPGSFLCHQKSLQMALELAKAIFRYKDSPEIKNSLLDPLFWFSHRSVITEMYLTMKKRPILYIGYELAKLVEEA